MDKDLVQVGPYTTVKRDKLKSALYALLLKSGSQEIQMSKTEILEVDPEKGFPVSRIAKQVLFQCFFSYCIDSKAVKDMFRLLGIKDSLPRQGKFIDIKADIHTKGEMMNSILVLGLEPGTWYLSFFTYGEEELKKYESFRSSILQFLSKVYLDQLNQVKKEETLKKENECKSGTVPPIDGKIPCFNKDEFIILKHNKLK